MGNSQENKYDLPKYQWVWVGNHNGLDLYRRTTDGLVAERRRITLDHRFSMDNQRQIYKMRQHNNSGFVKVYQVDGVEEAQPPKKSNICTCAENTNLNVYSERIEHRLSDLPQLTFPQSIHLLNETASSFQQIYQKYGPFHINGELIGVNSDNKVKVWLNENWGLNHPSHEITFLKTMSSSQLPPQLRNQKEMVHNLLQVIEEKTERGRYPQPFGKNIYQNAQSWVQLKRYLQHYQQNEYKDFIPNIIKRSTVVASSNQINTYQHLVDIIPNRNALSEPMNSPQIVQSNYVPAPSPSSKPVYGQKVQGSIIFTNPNDIHTTTPLTNTSTNVVNTSNNAVSSRPPPPSFNSKPTVNFGNMGRTVDNQINTNNTWMTLNNAIANNYQPATNPNIKPAQNMVPAWQPSPSNPEVQTTEIKKIMPMNEPQPITQTTYHPPSQPSYAGPAYSSINSPSPSSEPRPDLQLQKIRNMLKEDMKEFNTKHSSQYKITEPNRPK